MLNYAIIINNHNKDLLLSPFGPEYLKKKSI